MKPELIFEAKQRIEAAKKLMDAIQKKLERGDETWHATMLKEDKHYTDPMYFEIWVFTPRLKLFRAEGTPTKYLFKVKVDEERKKILILDPHLEMKNPLYGLIGGGEAKPKDLGITGLAGWKIIYE